MCSMRRWMSTSRSVIWPPGHYANRVTHSLFCGKVHGDDQHLRHFSKELDAVKESLKKNDKNAFLVTAFEVIRKFETIEGPFHLNPELMFNGPDSHIHEAYKQSLSICFNKAIHAMTELRTNNHSGYYFVGPRGIGKTTALQTCCLVAGAIIPNFVPIYIDCKELGAKTPSPSVLFAEAFEKTVPKGTKLKLDKELGLTGILNYAETNKLALGLFIDELQDIYVKENPFWGEIHKLITGFRTAVFATGSDSKLRLFIEAKERDLIQKITGQKALQDLNGTKLVALYFTGFTKLLHYQIYLNNRPSMKKLFFPAHADKKVEQIPGSDQVIRGLHYKSNGIIRGITMYEDNIPLSYLKDMIKLPNVGTLEWKVMNFIAHKGDGHTGTKICPFTMPKVKMEELIRSSEGLTTETLLRMVDDEYLIQVLDDDKKVNLMMSAAQQDAIRKINPLVFVSHAVTNEKGCREGLAFLKKYTSLIMCEDMQAELSGTSAKAWEKRYTTLQSATHFVIVILSKDYCAQVEKFTETSDNGCGREFFDILLQLEKPEKATNILLTYQDTEGSYSKVVTPFVRNKLKNQNGEERFIMKLSNWAAISTRVLGTELRGEKTDNPVSKL